MNVLVQIWKDKLSDYVILDYIFKIWIFGLLGLFVFGFMSLATLPGAPTKHFGKD